MNVLYQPDSAVAKTVTAFDRSMALIKRVERSIDCVCQEMRRAHRSQMSVILAIAAPEIDHEQTVDVNVLLKQVVRI